MRSHFSSLAAVLALVLSTAAAAQSITDKPVTRADRMKAHQTAPATPPATATSDTTAPVVSSPTAVQPAVQDAAPVSSTQMQPATPQSTAPGQTGTTPGQEQTAPGQASQLTPAQTGTTPSGQPVPSDQTQAAQVTAATAADVKSGVTVYDQKGGVVGKVESVSGGNAVVSTGGTRAAIPLGSFAKSDRGLVIGMTKSELEASAKQSAPKTVTKTTTTTKTTKKPK
jgi:hypothetical protein